MDTSTQKKYTYADYERLPEGAPYQLINGDLIMTPAATPFHQVILRRIAFLLTSYIENRHAGEVITSPIDVYFSDTETYQPDIIFISEGRRKIIGPKNIRGAPDLVIEILSPSTGYYDLTHKKDVYELSGVMEYWIVDPDQKAIDVFFNEMGVFRQKGRWKNEGEARSTMLGGFSVKIAEIFKPI